MYGILVFSETLVPEFPDLSVHICSSLKTVGIPKHFKKLDYLFMYSDVGILPFPARCKSLSS